jgi:hypothetical protein
VDDRLVRLEFLAEVPVLCEVGLEVFYVGEEVGDGLLFLGEFQFQFLDGFVFWQDI